MNQSSNAIAGNASFQAFINSYLREQDEGEWCNAKQWHSDKSGIDFFGGAQVLEIKLVTQKIKMALDIGYRSLVGRHTIKAVVVQRSLDAWMPIDFFTALMLLVTELYEEKNNTEKNNKNVCARHEKQMEFMLRLIESHQVMARYLQARAGDPALLSDRFIDSEQSLLFGHWLHPTPKSRQGLADWLHESYAPELCGKFQLHYFAVKRTYIRQESSLSISAEDILRASLKHAVSSVHLESDEILIPAHPLQAQWLIHQPTISQAIKKGWIRDLGKLGVDFTATSSVRTVYTDQFDWMLKFSIPVKITNSLRLNHCAELVAGVVMAGLLEKCGFSQRYPMFKTINDPAYMTVQLPDQAETGFELIIRENPFVRAQDHGVHSIAALVQDPLPGHGSRLGLLIRALAAKEQRNLMQVSLDWFEHYWSCAVVPLIMLYEEEGIALEAHQQNSLLDVTQGYPTQYYYRDNQGFYLSPAHKENLLVIEPRVAHTPELFYDDEMICDRFSYYLIINQLYSIIYRLGVDGLVAEKILLEKVRGYLQDIEKNLTGTGKYFVKRLLRNTSIPCKANLLTRVEDIDELTAELELAVYTAINNPLATITDSSKLEVSYEVA